MDDDAKLRRVKAHVAALKGFYIHATIYALVISVLVIINVVTQSPWWVQWPLLGWGAGLLAHATAVFRPVRLFGPDWEERKIKKLMEKS